MHHRLHPTRAGFTLIELLAVLLILSILGYFLITNLLGGQKTVQIGIAKQNIAQIATMLGQFSDDHGEYPASKLPADLGAANALNVGSECLYLALCAKGAAGYGTLDKDKGLCNTDDDSLPKVPKGFEKQELFELADPWGNPVAYIRASDYDLDFRYVCRDAKTGEEVEYTVHALKNSKTGRYEEPNSFQLLSAGPDGKFGSVDGKTGDGDDDLANFKK